MKLTPLIVIAVCIGMYFLYIGPSITEVQAMRAKADEYTNVLQKTKQLASQRDTVLTVFNNITQADIDRLGKVIPEKFDAVLFGNDIYSIAARYGLSVKNFGINDQKSDARGQVAEETRSNLYKASKVTITLIGSYEGFISFLKEMESNLRLVDLSSLVIQPQSNQKTGPAALSFTLEAQVYSLR